MRYSLQALAAERGEIWSPPLCDADSACRAADSDPCSYSCVARDEYVGERLTLAEQLGVDEMTPEDDLDEFISNLSQAAGVTTLETA